jgi:hypothetical protein
MCKVMQTAADVHRVTMTGRRDCKTGQGPRSHTFEGARFPHTWVAAGGCATSNALPYNDGSTLDIQPTKQETVKHTFHQSKPREAHMEQFAQGTNPWTRCQLKDALAAPLTMRAVFVMAVVSAERALVSWVKQHEAHKARADSHQPPRQKQPTPHIPKKTRLTREDRLQGFIHEPCTHQLVGDHCRIHGRETQNGQEIRTQTWKIM